MAKRKVADALLRERNAEDYRFEKMLADAACLQSKIDAEYGSPDGEMIVDNLTGS